MPQKLSFKDIEREINAEFYCLDEKILFGKQKTITNLIDSMDAKQYNLFKKYLDYEKKIQTSICKELMHKCIKAIIDNPEKYDFSDMKKDSTIM